ncbi:MULTISPECIES: alanine--tRNA ligase [unclassified Brevundimonas]|uniref:alanine--tRNA ligase n=1 Tax=unclassified Brevundimonas TaxID=2622653 RepID=UPI000CFBC5C0|nr:MULTISPECIES: alanine--tRNA ligase [unclassified Brevundimonas]PRA27743.1 alanine--tRNA ligase [Brevundimonas sp. MYb27]PQZ81096.1 alanine--tRNA ligase [Brevundimonas sp. MYb31]PRB15337.1 alanine--tRNA ligase [Brevundimonas sp. MYb52]PRB35740.1 alanine--tRNA ligase [Brevundimonas sp. MYb46]PRB44681.1 alanine--tRNA ligase [Brevundimonas sp. MYb33]
MTSLKQIRSTFLDYFAADGHEKVQSAPLVPQNDPTLLFVNAGMVPFKDYFTGAAVPPYKRATSSQKCVRAGGKHNDLDNVGYTARHHTFFEMLGNFSFGDYFKDHAIESAWNLLTKEFGLDANRLLVTVYHTDDEAFDIWKKVTGFADEKIIRIPTADNFWAMGDSGPSGPCTEIFYDHGDHIFGGPPGSPDEDGDRFVEIWNNVFMQFEKENDKIVRELPKKSVDTGMGLERIAAVLQGVHSNYDVDLFKTLINASEELTSTKAEGERAPSHRVIADHLRSASFLIADGVTPSNEGRGYVLRRIMRRAMRHAHLLGSTDPLMHRLVPTLVQEMGEAYPELGRAQAFIEDTLKQEEIRFRTTLGRGMNLFDQATTDFKAGDMLDGQTAFTLYDTYGFPLDLTQDEARRRGFSVNVDGFQSAMEEQRARSREHWTGSGQTASAGAWLALRDQHGVTQFTGYESETGEGTVVAILKDGVAVDGAEAGEVVEVVLNQTPFYGEGGGQAGDKGGLVWTNGEGRVLDTKKHADLFVHTVQVAQGAALTVGAVVTATVEPGSRPTTRANHSAAHLLHAALKNVLGPHVAQKGQMVDAERMRFDFSHNAPLTDEEIARLEDEVNAVIRQNIPTTTQLMNPEAAIEAGAVALFGEKYGDEVRVLTLGHALSGDGAYSVELCGGTHVHRTGDIALFKIVSEGGVAAGVRRIEALTGDAARRFLLDQANVARQLAQSFKIQTADVPARVEALSAERKALEKQVADLKKQLALGGGAGANAAPETINGVTLIARVLDGVDGKGLRGVAEDFKKQIGSGVVALVGVTDGKAAITVAATPDMAGKVNAADLARDAVIAMGGKGAGGKPDFAQGGAPDGAKAEAGLDAIRAALKG